MRVLAGDIGGTKSLLALCETEGETIRIVREARFDSEAYPGLEAIVTEFLGPGGTAGIDAAGFGIAGPIVDGESRAVNLAWQVVESRLAADIGIPRTRILNDLEAVGLGIPRLRPEDAVPLQVGTENPHGTIAVIGAGTGLGEGFLTWSTLGYQAHPSEGGHCDFAPRTSEECALLDFLRTQHDHVSCERVLSGPGLISLYRFVIARGAPESPLVRDEMAAAEDPAPIVTQHALSRSDEACIRALDIFVSVYGAEAGNLALKVMPTGGVYIVGGIAPRIAGKLQDGPFIEAFRSKGRHASILERIPVRLVIEPRVGLIGAASIAAVPRAR
jgi:glucokinase